MAARSMTRSPAGRPRARRRTTARIPSSLDGSSISLLMSACGSQRRERLQAVRTGSDGGHAGRAERGAATALAYVGKHEDPPLLRPVPALAGSIRLGFGPA